MSTIKFNESELQELGEYPKEGTYYGYPVETVERLNTPVSTEDNFLNYYQYKDYEWIPNVMTDLIDITPHCNKDVDACDFEGGYDAFGVKWIPVPGGDLPAFVEPGFTVLEDIENWKEMVFPDVESWAWKEYADRYNKAYQEDDRLRRGVLLSGYFERLISIMGFENAAMSLLEDPDSVSDFFARLTDVNIQIADHYIDDFGCKMIMVHDDWGSQRSQFFSLDTCMEVIVPHMKRLVDHVHEKGALFTLHSCGNGLGLIPAMKAIGIDSWQAQGAALDRKAAYQAIGNDFILELHAIEIPEELHGEELEDFIRKNQEEWNVPYRSTTTFYDFVPDRAMESRKAIYKVSREMAQKLSH